MAPNGVRLFVFKDLLILLFLYLSAVEGVVRGMLYKIYSVDMLYGGICAVYTDVGINLK